MHIISRLVSFYWKYYTDNVYLRYHVYACSIDFVVLSRSDINTENMLLKIYLFPIFCTLIAISNLKSNRNDEEKLFNNFFQYIVIYSMCKYW